MTAPEHDPHPDDHDPRLRALPGGRALRPDEPLDHELCLFVLGLVRDRRPVPPELAARARAWAQAHPETAQADVDMARISLVMAEERGLLASPEFADRVMERFWADERSGGRTLGTLGGLAAAAVVLLALVAVWDGARPVATVADKGLEREAYAVDAFRPDPFGADDLDGGLEALFPYATPRSGEAGDDAAPSEQGDG